MRPGAHAGAGPGPACSTSRRRGRGGPDRPRQGGWRRAGAGLALLGVVSSACLSRPLLPFSLETPPLVLAPAALAGVTDARGRFREVYCALREDHGRWLPEDRPCEDALVRLLDEPPPTGSPVVLGPPRRPLRVAVVPGLFGECLAPIVTPFADALAHLATHGYRTALLPVSGLGSSAHNAGQLRNALLGLDLAPGERVLLVGHSKGTTDALEALGAYPELRPRVAALASVAGVVAGSPLADAIPAPYLRLLRRLGLPPCLPADGGGVASLRRATRLAALARAPLPAEVRYFSLGGIVDRGRVSALLRAGHARLAEVDPRNDGQVVFSDVVIPGGVLLGFVRADHWAMALPFSRRAPALAATVLEHNAFPREVLLEAIVRTVEETLWPTPGTSASATRDRGFLRRP